MNKYIKIEKRVWLSSGAHARWVCAGFTTRCGVWFYFFNVRTPRHKKGRVWIRLYLRGEKRNRAAWWMQNLTRASTHPPAWQQHELTTGKGGWMGWGRRKKNRAHTRPHAQQREERSSATGACCHYRYYCDCRRHCLSPHSSRYPSSQSSNSITLFFLFSRI